MKEAYVSYEVAKLLKEKGFDESSFAYYSKFDDWKILRFWRKYARNPINTFYLCAPTHQMAMAWLREKNIHIDFYYLPIHKKYVWSVVETKDPKGTGSEELYEDAVETAIKYCLENLI